MPSSFNRKTITPAQNITDPKTLLSSADGIFSLGFFSLGNSGNRYVGIWYTNIPEKTIVWVANRDDPVTDSSGVLRIADDGNLVLLDSQGKLYWTTNVSNVVSKNSVAELLDTGNLILQETTTTSDYNKTLWQSFDHPTDTLLPMMKFGVNLRTGVKQAITSWKDDFDPSVGNFSLELSPSVAPQLIIKKGSERYWRSGPWMIFAGQTQGDFAKSNPFKTSYDLVRDDLKGSVYLAIFNASALRLILGTDGILIEKQWNETKKEWQDNWITTSRASDCEVYNICGPFGYCDKNGLPICSCWKGFKPKFETEWRSGNWSGGCVRSKKLQCEITSNETTRSGTDLFEVAYLKKLPDYSYPLEGINTEMQCRQYCLSNCSCSAYLFDGTHSFYRNGCLLWMGGLMDVQVFIPGLLSYFILQIRVANDSAMDYSKTPNTASITGFVLGGVIGVGIIGVVLYCWRSQILSCLRWIANTIISCCRWIANTIVSCWRWMAKQGRSLCGCFPYLIGKMSSEKKTVQREAKTIQLGGGNPIPTKPAEIAEPATTNGGHPDFQKFNFEDLSKATNQFSEANELGKGGFGTVYKVTLSDGREVAVKRLSLKSANVVEDFENEVRVISQLQHRNLVRIHGSCIHGEEKLMVFEYVPNNSLDLYLFDPNTMKRLNWKMRFNIIEGICKGVVYLHQDSNVKVIHRDLKAANILLDMNLKPKIADFGLAKIFGDDEFGKITSKVTGTGGYISPEYYAEGRFSEKSDVFSFGVLLLEIVSGKKNYTRDSPEQPFFNIINYAWQIWKGKNPEYLIDKIMLLNEPHIQKNALRCINVGFLCVEASAEDRPTMHEALKKLTNDTPLDAPMNPAFIERRRMNSISEGFPTTSANLAFTDTTIRHLIFDISPTTSENVSFSDRPIFDETPPTSGTQRASKVQQIRFATM